MEILKKWNSLSLVVRILIGLLIGAALGLAVPGMTWIGVPGKLFVGALKAIAPLLVFVLVYAKRTRVAAVGQEAATATEKLTGRQIGILSVLGLTVVMLVVGVTRWEWYMPEITGLFLLMGIVCGLIAGFGPNRIADELIAGARDILSAALVVGFASGIIVILQEGRVVDSILHAMQEGLDGQGPMASLSAMYGIQAVINFLIPSASAKAAITIPIMAPFADMVGVSRQAMVLAFQFGDGFTNMLTPTSGVLMAALAMARIPYAQWVRWVWKGTVALLVLGLLLLLATVLFPVPEF